MTMTLLNTNEYVVVTGPNGNIYIADKDNPHLCYSLDAALKMGIIKITIGRIG